MTPRLEDVTARAGEPVLAAWGRLRRWARGWKLIKGDPRIRFNQIDGRGTFVTADFPDPVFVGAFPVALQGATATVGQGRVNNLVPTLGGVRLDGMTAKKAIVLVPPLKLSGGPGPTLESWICLRFAVDLKSGAVDLKNPDVATILHVSALDPRAADGGYPDDGNGGGLQPLALVTWRDKATPERVFQITLHNLNHSFVRAPQAKIGDPPAVDRHFFSAV